MDEKIHCSQHGESEQAYLCVHLVGEAVGIGFNRDETSGESPFPDAWCDDCEIIRAANGGWNEESEKLTRVSLVCSKCYVRAQIRNTRTAITFSDLSGLRWKCTSCEEWHAGACLDFSYHAPYYWKKEHESENRLAPHAAQDHPGSYLNADYCAIEDEHFFVRGLIELPIIGSAETFCWGVWGSLSRQNFEIAMSTDQYSKRADTPAMFSWLSSQISDYPDTLSLKMQVHLQDESMRPAFELELSDHPLSREYHGGISPQRVKEIMLGRLREVQ